MKNHSTFTPYTIYPKQNEMPLEIKADNLVWELRDDLGFWLATDELRRKWLFKMRGSISSYRERVAALILEYIGIRTQASTYIKLPPDSEPRLKDKHIEEYQLAIAYISEHPADEQYCKVKNCPHIKMRELQFENNLNTKALNEIDIDGVENIPKLEIISYLLGATEPPGFLFSIDHKCYIIDNESCFYTAPTDPVLALGESKWLVRNEFLAETISICRLIANIQVSAIEKMCILPSMYEFDEAWRIREIIMKVTENARNCLKKYT